MSLSFLIKFIHPKVEICVLFSFLVSLLEWLIFALELHQHKDHKGTQYFLASHLMNANKEAKIRISLSSLSRTPYMRNQNFWFIPTFFFCKCV